MKKICVVIPNWNGVEFIGDTLKSLQKQTIKHEAIVVDNGSTDGSLDYIKTNFPEVTVLPFVDNAGFAGGVNRGISYALDHKASYIALLNNDATVDKDWLKHLTVAISGTDNIGISTSKILLEDGIHLDSTGEHYTIWGLPFPRGRNQKDVGQFDNQRNVFGASGGASLYKAELFKDIGMFDEDFFAYYEDVDISFRAQLAGWKVHYQPKAVAYHKLSQTSSKLGDFARYHSAKNFILLYARNMPRALYMKYTVCFTLQFARMAASSILRRKFTVFITGTWTAIKLHSNTKSKRKLNLSRQRVSNAYIDELLIHSRPPRIPDISKN